MSIKKILNHKYFLGLFPSHSCLREIILLFAVIISASLVSSLYIGFSWSSLFYDFYQYRDIFYMSYNIPYYIFICLFVIFIINLFRKKILFCFYVFSILMLSIFIYKHDRYLLINIFWICLWIYSLIMIFKKYNRKVLYYYLIDIHFIVWFENLRIAILHFKEIAYVYGLWDIRTYFLFYSIICLSCIYVILFSYLILKNKSILKHVNR